MSHQVFISHESSSLPFVEILAKTFEENDVFCWYAPRDLDKSSAGKEYDDALVDAIHEASAIVVVLNDLALQSIWVKREVSQAEKQGKMIFPFVISKLTINNGLLMRLEDKHLINAYPEPNSRIPVLLKNVKQLLGQDVLSSNPDDTPTDNSAMSNSLKNKFDFDFDEGLALIEAGEERDAFLAFLRSAENGCQKTYDYMFKIIFENSKDIFFLDDSTWEHIEELSDMGMAFADLLMHYKYYGMGTQNEIAIKYLKRAMDKQVSPYVYLQMGICYGWGLGFNANSILELHYYKKALDTGCYAACSYIGQLYMYGSEKIDKDLKKAEEYLRKGAEKGISRCYMQLYNLFVNKKEYDNAFELLQYMIEHNIRGGYSLMGNYFYCDAPEEKRNTEKAIDWYKQAINHREQNAWGALSLIYWNNDEHDEAYQMAQKGCLENDSLSLFTLGYFYEQDAEDNDYLKAWNCYLQRVQRFGTDASSLANLYLNYNYLPQDFSLEKLKQLLETDVKLQRVESIECLIKIILKEHKRDTTLSYDSLCDLPEVYDYIRIGAEQGDSEINSELMYIYGRILIEKSGKIHNPYKGIDFVESSMNNGNTEAMIYAFDYYTRKKNETKLCDLSSTVIRLEMFPIDYIELVLDKAQGIVSSENLYKWIKEAFNKLGKDVKYIKARFKLYQKGMEMYSNGIGSIADEDMDIIRKDINSNQQAVCVSGCLHLLKDYLHLIYPNYNKESILKGDFSNIIDFSLFYNEHNYSSGIRITTNIKYEDNVYGIIESLIPKDEIINYTKTITDDNDITKTFCFRRAYDNVLFAYKNLLEDNKAMVLTDNLDIDISHFIPYCPSEYVIMYCKLSMKMLISSFTAFGDDWREIVDNLDNLDKLLDIAEIMEDENAQLLLISYVETCIEGDNLWIRNNNIRSACDSHSSQPIIEELNRYIDEFNTIQGVHKVNIEKYNETNLPPSVFLNQEVVVNNNKPQQNVNNDHQQDEDGRYDILQNSKGEIIIVIKYHEGGPDQPRMVYDGADTALLYRNRNSAVMLENIDSTAREPLRKAKEVLVTETKGDDVIREYKAPVRLVDSLQSLYE